MKPLRYKTRLGQTVIYLGKFFRMFIFQNDWKVLPMGAIIAGIVTFVIGSNLFVTQEGTLEGSFALVCVCIWNGCFNSIQVVCRERSIVKREHRAGLHISSYILAHMIYQLFLCAAQTAVTILICKVAGVTFPAEGVVTPWGMLDAAITIFLVTYAADMLALMVSCLVRDTTTAMTVMPFLLILQLVFSGGIFALDESMKWVSYIMISHWGLNCLCAIGGYNTLPMVTLWNTLFKFRDVVVHGKKPLLEIIYKMQEENTVDDFLLWSGSYNTEDAYIATTQTITHNWTALVILVAVFAALAMLFLEFIDRDRR